jgi:TPR repeat protein
MQKFFQYFFRLVCIYFCVIEDSPTGDSADSDLTLEQIAELKKQHPKENEDTLEKLILDAENGNALAQSSLGMIFFDAGQNTDNSVRATEYFAKSREWFKKAAQQGHASGQNGMGLLCQLGADEPADFIQAIRWYHLAAEQGDASAQNNLGNLYLESKDEPKNHLEAFKWHLKAAEQGIASAQCMVGAFYAKGSGNTLQNPVEAIKWFRRAAAQKNTTALVALAYHYFNGLGTYFNKAAGYALLRLADAYKSVAVHKIKTMLSYITKQLPKKQIQLGNALFEEMSKSDDLLKTLDDYVSSHTEKVNVLAKGSEYAEMIGRILRSNAHSPVEFPTNSPLAKPNRKQRRSKSKKR